MSWILGDPSPLRMPSKEEALLTPDHPSAGSQAGSISGY